MLAQVQNFFEDACLAAEELFWEQEEERKELFKELLDERKKRMREEVAALQLKIV